MSEEMQSRLPMLLPEVWLGLRLLLHELHGFASLSCICLSRFDEPEEEMDAEEVTPLQAFESCRGSA